MNYIKTHLFYILMIAGLVVAGRVWLSEHDARVAAEVTVKADEAQSKVLQGSIDELKKSIVDNDSRAAADRAALQHALAAVKTAPQAIAAIPSVSDLALNTRPSIDNPTQVSVDAVPLYQELNQCRQNSVSLGACQSDLASEKAIEEKEVAKVVLKDDEIKTLKKKPNFLHRLWGVTKIVGSTAAIVLTLTKLGIL